jgi:hypothetical protein
MQARAPPVGLTARLISPPAVVYILYVLLLGSAWLVYETFKYRSVHHHMPVSPER